MLTLKVKSQVLVARCLKHCELKDSSFYSPTSSKHLFIHDILYTHSDYLSRPILSRLHPTTYTIHPTAEMQSIGIAACIWKIAQYTTYMSMLQI